MKSKRKSGSALKRRTLLIPLLIIGASLLSLRAVAHTPVKTDTGKHKMIIEDPFIKLDNDTLQSDAMKAYVVSDWSPVGEPDSMNYVINGKSSSKAEFSRLDAKDIEAMHLIAPENAEALSQKFNNKYNILFVTTANSAAGKALLPKLEKICGDRSLATGRGKTVSIYRSADSKKDDDDKYHDDFQIADKAVTVNVDPKAHFQVIDLKPVAGAVNIIYPTKGMSYVMAGNNKVHLINGKTTNAYAYSIGGGGKVKNLSSGNFYVAGKPAYKVMAFNEMRPGVETVDNFDSKLIIIDGKEATEGDLKKLSAFDIDKIDVKDDFDTHRKYGDKAKKGVVYISTKKAKK